jgi:very-short-patch-repair endonuclease
MGGCVCSGSSNSPPKIGGVPRSGEGVLVVYTTPALRGTPPIFGGVFKIPILAFMTHLYNRPDSIKTRKQLRKTLTPAEALLWKNLQRNQLENRKFRRQYSIGKYIVDFYCADERVAIELDGEVHNNIGTQQYDDERTEYLQSLNIKVLRFENAEVFTRLENLLEAIRQEFKLSP